MPTGPQIYYKGGDRIPDYFKMQAGMLTRITYPAGAVDEFEYEQHEYGFIGSQTVQSLGEFVTVQEGIEDKEAHVGAGTQPLYKKVFSRPYKMGEDFIELPKGKYVLKAVATAGRIVGTQGMLYDDAKTFYMELIIGILQKMIGQLMCHQNTNNTLIV